MKKMFVCLTLAALLFCTAVNAEVRLPKTLTSNMVLQRDVPVNIWGWCAPNEEISVTFGDKSVSVKGDESGHWLATLPASEATCDGKDLVVKGENEIVLNNVVVGEVWVCSGQSNMEQPLNSWGQPRLSCTEEELKGDYSNIRFNRVHHVLAPEEVEDIPSAGWQVCKGGTQAGCTACGFHFAVRLQEELGVPVGLIDSNWGGSNINSWIPAEGWSLLPELADAANEVAGIKKTLDEREGYSTPATGLNQQAFDELHVSGKGAMYNAMLAPWKNYAFRGAIWYQGESNAGEGEFYYFKQRAMIEQWRKTFSCGEFPFYWCQLANFQAASDDPADSGAWPALRDGQTKCLQVPKTGQAILIDIGEEGDIHPRNKFDVGNRLAFWALVKDYGKEMPYASPLFKELKIDGNKAIVTFDCVGSGLMVGKKEGRGPALQDENGKLNRFAIAGADGKWFWGDAVVTGADTVEVTSANVAEPVAVRYAWQMNPTGCNLYTKDGLPATPFRTDK
ncbi:MAG: sialate O-acetylesterase [Planctomycetia bacterium]|nr:sialate O-acetylesterase [Planctomycetia bacterium]